MMSGRLKQRYSNLLGPQSFVGELPGTRNFQVYEDPIRIQEVKPKTTQDSSAPAQLLNLDNQSQAFVSGHDYSVVPNGTAKQSRAEQPLMP
jgi:hypothetical protein